VEDLGEEFSGQYLAASHDDVIFNAELAPCETGGQRD